MSENLADFDPARIDGWHAHVYYRDAGERAIAARIRAQAEAQFPVTMGRWRDEPVGPHPLPMYQIAFAPELLPAFLPWLMSVRGPLSILVHARTHVSDYLDHTRGATWLGEPLALNLDFFDETGKSA